MHVVQMIDETIELVNGRNQMKKKKWYSEENGKYNLCFEG